MIKQFFKDGFIYTFGNILTKSINVLLLPLYTRVLSPDDYGTIEILSVFATLINLTIALEISQGIGRFYPEAKEKSDKIIYASTSLWFTIFTYTLFSLICLLSSVFLSRMFFGTESNSFLVIISTVSIWFSGLIYLIQNQLRWDFKAKYYSILNLLFSGLSIAFSIYFILILKSGIVGVYYSSIITSILVLIVGFYFTKEIYRFSFDFTKLKEMISYSLPLVPSGIGVFIALYIDRLAINYLLGIGDVGIYGIASKFASILMVIMSGFQMSVTPLIFTNYKDEGTPKEIAKIFSFFMGLAFALLMGMSIFSWEIITVFTAPEYISAYRVLPLIAFSMLLSGMYVFAPGVSIAKKTKTVALINIIAASINTCLNFIFIPLIGLPGSSLATLISFFIQFCLYIYYGQKIYPIPYKWQEILISAIITGLVCGAGISFFSLSFSAIMGKILLLISGILFIAFYLIKYDIRSLKNIISFIRSKKE
jgi:O-antigen/teichoic acid export membrane protein